MRVYRYKWTILAAIDLTLVLLVAVAVFGFLIVRRGELATGFVFILLGFLLFLPLYINARFSLSTIRLDESSIGARVCDIEWKTINWSSVKRIRKLRSYNMALGRESYTIAIDITERPTYFLLKNGPIIFGDFIDDVGSLIEFINQIIGQHKIGVFVPDGAGRHTSYRPFDHL
jgi:hypothetical protein